MEDGCGAFVAAAACVLMTCWVGVAMFLCGRMESSHVGRVVSCLYVWVFFYISYRTVAFVCLLFFVGRCCLLSTRLSWRRESVVDSLCGEYRRQMKFFLFSLFLGYEVCVCLCFFLC